MTNEEKTTRNLKVIEQSGYRYQVVIIHPLVMERPHIIPPIRERTIVAKPHIGAVGSCS